MPSNICMWPDVGHKHCTPNGITSLNLCVSVKHSIPLGLLWKFVIRPEAMAAMATAAAVTIAMFAPGSGDTSRSDPPSDTF